MKFALCIAIASRPSVRLSVRLVDQDHIGWKSWKLIARTISPTSLLFVAQRPSTYSNGKHWEILGWEKVAYWSTKAAISLKHVKIEEKLLWRAYRKSPTNKSPLKILGKKEFGCIQIFWVPPIVTGTGKAMNFKFCTHILSLDRNNKSPLKILGKVAVGVVRDSRNFSGHPCNGRIMRSSLWQFSFLVIKGNSTRLVTGKLE